MQPTVRTLTHDHIDGSAALTEIITDLYKMAGQNFHFRCAAEWVEYFQNPHADIVSKFGTVTRVLQSREALQMAVSAYVARRAKEGYRYLEAKFAPAYHTAGGLSMAEAADVVCQTLWAEGRKHRIVITPHLCINREAPAEVGIEIAKIALSYDGQVVLDMACDEANHPPEKHLQAYKLTFGTKTMRDCHAAEWTMAEPRDTYWRRLHENLLTAIFVLKCDGVGHAVTLCRDDELIKHVAENCIRISGCPLSNVVCGAIKDVRELQIDKLIDAGVIYTLNADDDLFLPPMPEVLSVCDRAYGFSERQIKHLHESQKYSRVLWSLHHPARTMLAEEATPQP